MRASTIDSQDYREDNISSDRLYGGTGRPKYDRGDTGIWQPTGSPSVAHNGLCFAIPLFLVQRMNQGAYHPEFNSEGCSGFHRTTATWNDYWYAATAKVPTSTADCFKIGLDYTTDFTSGQGSISAAQSRRPTNDTIQYFDAIYAEQVHDLRIDANRKTTDELLTEYSRKGIAGTIRGKESVPFSTVYDDAGSGSSPNNTRKYIKHSNGQLYVYIDTSASNVEVGDYIYLQDVTKSVIIRGKVALTDAVTFSVSWDSDASYVEVLGSLAVGEEGTGNEVYYIIEKQLTSEYETLPWQDIIGYPERIAATFVNGCYGRWIPVLPSGAPTAYPYNKKLLSGGEISYFTSNDGTSWATLAWTPDTVLNQTDAKGLSATQVHLIPYSTTASPYELADNSVVKSELGDVFASCNFGAFNAIPNHLLGKVTTGQGGTSSIRSRLTTHLIDHSYGDTIAGNAAFIPTHATIPLGTGTTNKETSPTVKAFPYITSENQQYYLQWVYKEMKWDTGLDNAGEFTALDSGVPTSVTEGELCLASGGLVHTGNYSLRAVVTVVATLDTLKLMEDGFAGNNGELVFKFWDGNGYGDNNKFTIVSNESTETDENGNTIIIGQKRVALPNLTDKSE
jgi:hypothetical protein